LHFCKPVAGTGIQMQRSDPTKYSRLSTERLRGLKE
jgi:hypothetical protein